MSKVLKVIAVVAAIAVNVIPGVGQVLSATILGSLSGAVIAATTLIGISAATSLLQRKPRFDATGITGRLQLSDQVDQWIAVGETALPSQMIFWGTSGGENKELSIIVAHACHPIHSFTGLTINGVSTSFPTPGGDYSGILSIQTAIGNHTTNPFTGIQGGWTGPGRDLAMSHFRWTYNQEKLTSGLPQNIQFTGKGIRVYDPRRDSTRGGSGSMRADDETTWAYEVGGTALGNNPALVHLSYLLGWKKNGLLWAGKGESPTDINFADYIAAANICDELVSGERRYTIGGLISLAEAHNINEGRILSCCAGKKTDAGGLLGIWVAHDDTAVPLMSFTAGDIVGDIKWEPLPEGQTRNTARGSFLDPANAWTAQPYQEVRPTDLLDLDNGVELVDRLDFPMVTNANQARRLAGIRLRESRQGVYTAPLRLKALGAQTGRVVAQTLAQQGWTNKRFRVETMTLERETVTVRARAVAAGDYADAGPSTLVPASAPPTLGYVPFTEDGATRNVARGTYDAGTTYTRGDEVIFSGSSYRLIVDSSTGNAPPDVSRWALFGAAGTGTPGADGIEGITVIVSNEAHTVPTNADGSGGSYASAGGTMILRRGATLLTPTFSIAAQSPATGWASIDASTGVYTVTDPGVTLATATLRANVGGVNYDRTYTLAKSLQGLSGPNLTLVTDAQAFTFTDGAANPGSQTITLTALLTNLSGTATWTATPSVTLGGTGNTRTLALADFGANRQVTVEATLGGITDRITIVRLERNVVAANGANLVRFSRFERSGEGWRLFNPLPLAVTTTHTTEDGRRVRRATFTATAANQTITNEQSGVGRFNVRPGERLSVRALLEASGNVASWALRQRFRTAALAIIGSDITVASGTGAVAISAGPQGGFADAPAGAVFSELLFFVTSSGAGTFTAAIAEPMISQAAAGQTAHPAFTPGPAGQDGATVGAPAGTLVAAQEAAALVADAATAKNDSASALSTLATIANDAVLSRDEKPDVRQKRDAVIGEFATIRDRADSFGVSRTAYATAYTNLIDYLATLDLAGATDTGITRSTFNGRFTDYYTLRQTVLDGIALVASQRANLMPANANRVPFSRFEGNRGGAIFFNPAARPTTEFYGTVDGKRVYLGEISASASGQAVAVQTEAFPVEAGERLSAQVRVGFEGTATRGPWAASLNFYDASGGFLSGVSIATGTGTVAWRTQVQQAFIDAPTGAFSARVAFLAESAGAGTVQAVIVEPMVTGAVAGQTQHPSFTAGPNSADGADVTRDVLPDLNKGAWAAGVAYRLGDIVTRNGSSYTCIIAHTSDIGNQPLGTNWALVADKGADGAPGDQGPTGVSAPPIKALGTGGAAQFDPIRLTAGQTLTVDAALFLNTGGVAGVCSMQVQWSINGANSWTTMTNGSASANLPTSEAVELEVPNATFTNTSGISQLYDIRVTFSRQSRSVNQPASYMRVV